MARCFRTAVSAEPVYSGIKIDIAFHQRFMREQNAAQVEFALHLDRQAPLNLLRQNLAQQHLLSEIFRAHHDVTVCRRKLRRAARSGRRELSFDPFQYLVGDEGHHSSGNCAGQYGAGYPPWQDRGR